VRNKEPQRGSISIAPYKGRGFSARSAGVVEKRINSNPEAGSVVKATNKIEGV
jgi:hypothetical protein